MPRIVLKELETDRTQIVSDTEAIVGRDPACGFVIDGPKSKVVSGRHARIFHQDDAWWVQDMSRNGTVLDDERLQAGQRHALREGQILGLGESGPRFRVATLEARVLADTMMEAPPNADVANSPKTTAPRSRPMVGGLPTGIDVQTSAMRKSEAMRAGVKFEEPTEPMSPAPDWHVHIVLRATHSDQRFEARAKVVKVGRSPECEIRIPPEQGAAVSRVHAEIAIEEGGVVVRDAGSRNGTFVNGTQIQAAHPAAQGVRIMLGAGGPTLAVDDLHIVKGSPSARSTPKPGIGGGPTPDAPIRGTALSSIREPPTAPSARDIAATGVKDAPRAGVSGSPFPKETSAGNAPPSRRGGIFQDVLEDLSQKSASRARTLIWVGLGILVVAAAVLLGRISAP